MCEFTFTHFFVILTAHRSVSNGEKQSRIQNIVYNLSEGTPAIKMLNLAEGTPAMIKSPLL